MDTKALIQDPKTDTCWVWQVVHSSCHSQGNPDKYKVDLNAVVAFLTQYINKKTPSVKVASVAQIRHTKRHKTSATPGAFKQKIKLKKHSREEYDSILMAQHQQL